MMQSQDMGTMVAGGRDLANGAVGLKPEATAIRNGGDTIPSRDCEGELVLGQDLFPVFDWWYCSA